MTLRQLVSSAARTAQTADDLGARFAKVLASVLRDTERRLVPILRAASDGSRTAIVRAAQANRTRLQIREALTQAGFDELADAAYGDALDRLVGDVLAARRLAQLSAEMTPRLASRIGALKALAQVDLLDEGDEAARALWQATVRGVFGSRSVDGILGDLARILDRTEPQIQTLYDTSVSVFGRQVEALQAPDEPATRFAYLGPVDAKVRPWCRAHVGKVYTRAEIDALDNGQLDNVFLTGGGYGCRHVWNEVSKYSEIYNYADPPKRVIPEIQDDLETLKEAA